MPDSLPRRAEAAELILKLTVAKGKYQNDRGHHAHGPAALTFRGAPLLAGSS